MIYGYARVSTDQQNLERQLRNIRHTAEVDRIYSEHYTGTTLERPEFKKLMKVVKSGDTIIFDSVSRMSRTADEGMELYKYLFNKGIELVFITEPHINTAVYRATLNAGVPMTGTEVDCILKGVNEYLMILAGQQIRIAFDQAEKERNDIADRVKQGMETARLNGKTIGRPKGATSESEASKQAKAKILVHSKTFGGSLTNSDLASMLGISRTTLIKYIKELKELEA